MYRCHCGAEFNTVQQYSGHVSGRLRAGESEHYAEPVPGRQVLRCPECSHAFYGKSGLKKHSEKLHLGGGLSGIADWQPLESRLSAGPEVSRGTPQIDLATALLDRFEDILLRNRDLTTENANLRAENQRLKVELGKMQSAYQGLRGVRDRAEELLAEANR